MPCSTRIFIMDNEQKSRLITEAQETAGRLNKLNSFMASETFPTLPREDKDLLYSQQRVMSEYVQILGKRIERTGEQFKHATQCEPAKSGPTPFLVEQEDWERAQASWDETPNHTRQNILSVGH